MPKKILKFAKAVANRRRVKAAKKLGSYLKDSVRGGLKLKVYEPKFQKALAKGKVTRKQISTFKSVQRKLKTVGKLSPQGREIMKSTKHWKGQVAKRNPRELERYRDRILRTKNKSRLKSDSQRPRRLRTKYKRKLPK